VKKRLLLNTKNNEKNRPIEAAEANAALQASQHNKNDKLRDLFR